MPSRLAVPNSAACRQQARSAAALSRKRSSWCEASPHLRVGTTSCIAFTCGRRLRLAWRISDRVECIRMLPFEKSSRCRERHLVLGGPKVSSSDSNVYCTGFGVLCSAHGGTNHRASGAGCVVAGPRAPHTRVSRRDVEGSSRISVSNHLWVFGSRVSGRDDCPLQAAAREEAANSERCVTRSRHTTPVEQARESPATIVRALCVLYLGGRGDADCILRRVAEPRGGFLLLGGELWRRSARGGRVGRGDDKG